MADILLSTVNARYAHSAFGLRYLLANLHELAGCAAIREFTLQDAPRDIVEKILQGAPRIVGFGVYIWNVAVITEVVTLLKALCPEIVVVLGGPEVSFETDAQAVVSCADYVICGEGEIAFYELCKNIVAGRAPDAKILRGALPDVRTMTLPYHLYTERDIAERVIYVEASRGCPYACEFCLSSLDSKVRRFDLDLFLAGMQDLLDRGVRQLKFIDRTFNLHVSTSRAILEFFLARLGDGLFLHFELIPDRLPRELREVIARFPRGSLQFEIGVQTLNPVVESRISRRQDHAKLEDNFAFLRGETGVHIHADLIAGLPGEDIDSFARGFDALVAMRPQEIQVGILKRLRGTPIARHTQSFGMVFSSSAPYEILKTAAMSFQTLQRIKRLARFWDLLANSGRFQETLPLLLDGASPFAAFMQLSDHLHERAGQSHGIALDRMVEMLMHFLIGDRGLDPTLVKEHLRRDYGRDAARRTPAFLAESPPSSARAPRSTSNAHHVPKRQARHLA